MCDQFITVDYRSSELNYNNMKPPNIPGTEKFRFSDKKYNHFHRDAVNSDSTSMNSCQFLRGIPSRSTCPSTPSIPDPTSQALFSRSDSRRKPILPISSRMTSRVLTLTHLPLDSFDIRDFSGNSRKHYNNGVKLSVPCDSRAPNTTSTSRVSLFSDYSGSQCSSQPSPRSLCSPLDRSLTPSQWAKNAHRLSTSSQSSWEDGPDPHDTLWTANK